MTKKECSALRGIAIIFIMLHNYCHWLPFAVPENEFSFSVEKYNHFWNVINWDMDWSKNTTTLSLIGSHLL